MPTVNVVRTGKQKDGIYYTQLQHIQEDEVFGDVIKTGWVNTKSEPKVEEGQELDLSSKRFSEIAWND